MTTMKHLFGPLSGARFIENALSFTLSMAIFTVGFLAGFWFRGSALSNAGAIACGDTGSFSLDETAWKDLPDAPAFGPLEPAFAHGEVTAPVHVLILVDYECPFSQRYIQQVFPRLLDQRDVYVEVHDFPLTSIHPNAVLAAQAARCAAEQGRYTEFVFRLFEESSVANVTQAASRAGLDGVAFEQCLEGQKYVVTDSGSQVTAAGFSSTPTTIINGKMVTGAADWAVIERLVKEATR